MATVIVTTATLMSFTCSWSPRCHSPLTNERRVALAPSQVSCEYFCSPSLARSICCVVLSTLRGVIVCTYRLLNVPLHKLLTLLSFRFLGDASGRWTCIDTLVVPARIVNTDFVGNSWQGNKAPQMLGGPAGPWQDYAHACAIGNLKVFLAGVFKMNADLAPYNAIAMLDLPIAPTSAWLTPAKIAAIACACTVHFLNILAVAVFVRRSQWCVRSLWPSCHWALAAVVMSGLPNQTCD
jgi:hypothetical protein